MENENRELKAKNLVEKAKKHFEKGDVENASKIWCEVHDLYEGANSEQEILEFHKIMALFTDNEVYTITDHLKEKYYNK